MPGVDRPEKDGAKRGFFARVGLGSRLQLDRRQLLVGCSGRDLREIGVNGLPQFRFCRGSGTKVEESDDSKSTGSGDAKSPTVAKEKIPK